LSALFFLSGLFHDFCASPDFVQFIFASGESKAWLIALTNSLIVAWVGGQLSLILYLNFVLVIALVLPEFLKIKISVEKSAVNYFSVYGARRITHSLWVTLCIIMWTPIVEVKNQVAGFVNLLGESS
jgi:hypothetical protein